MSTQSAPTRLYPEAAQSPTAAGAQLPANQGHCTRPGEHPRAIPTCARHSSDHAFTFARYLTETRLLTSSADPSVSSLYGSAAQPRGTPVPARSRGGDPDHAAHLRKLTGSL